MQAAEGLGNVHQTIQQHQQQEIKGKSRNPPFFGGFRLPESVSAVRWSPAFDCFPVSDFPVCQTSPKLCNPVTRRHTISSDQVCAAPAGARLALRTCTTLPASERATLDASRGGLSSCRASGPDRGMNSVPKPNKHLLQSDPPFQNKRDGGGDPWLIPFQSPWPRQLWAAR